MKKLWAVATMVFVITGFASTALAAGEGKYIQDKMRQDAEQRMSANQNEQTSDFLCCQVDGKAENLKD